MSLLQSSYPGSEAHPTSYRMGTGDPFPWKEAARAWRWPITAV